MKSSLLHLKQIRLEQLSPRITLFTAKSICGAKCFCLCSEKKTSFPLLASQPAAPHSPAPLECPDTPNSPSALRFPYPDLPNKSFKYLFLGLEGRGGGGGGSSGTRGWWSHSVGISHQECKNQSCACKKLCQLNPQPQKAEKWARPAPDSSVFSRGFSRTARNLHWNKEKSGLGTICLRVKRPELLCTFESSSPISLISCTFQVFHSAPGDKRFYKMTVQIERTEITTSDKRDAKLFINGKCSFHAEPGLQW